MAAGRPVNDVKALEQTSDSPSESRRETRAGVGAEFEGRLAGDPQHGRLEEIFERRRLGLDDVPGEPGGVVLLPA
jgi:hypothetical protein